jgi:hypothetical protein
VILPAVICHGRATAEKDCNNQYPERFHGGISKLICETKSLARGLGRGRLEIVDRAPLFRDEAPDG